MTEEQTGVPGGHLENLAPAQRNTTRTAEDGHFQDLLYLRRPAGGGCGC